ncbi:MAG TPA: gliding motility-associated C-terminal domain-containing protein [Bacteroidales bacterium]|nr:gliding motility-associated C-terminal domain-containing protein [Bacteroidales bacterium]
MQNVVYNLAHHDDFPGIRPRNAFHFSFFIFHFSFFTLLFLLLSTMAFAQLDAGPNDTINPGVPVTLTATYGNPGIPVILDDDDVAGPFPIGFSFRFFGNNFLEFYLGSNGWVSFTPSPNTAGVRNPIAVPTPDSKYPKNVIMGPWIDLFPKTSDTYVFYLTTGEAPNRQLVVMWCQVPMFSQQPNDCKDSIATFQIILHEGTNTIEDQILTKKSCDVWFDNRATLGMQNGNGSIGFAVPGRNNTSWTASEEGWLYTPISVDSFAIAPIPFHMQPMVPGNKIVYNWYEWSQPISTDQTITVAPNETTWYYVYLDLCSGIVLKDSVLIFVSKPIPNAFTPNGDGLNDYFRIIGTPTENITKYNFRIFNRWGQMVFNTNNIEEAWDGKSNGQYCPAGVYVWEIFYEDSKKTRVTNKGTVMLLL